MFEVISLEEAEWRRHHAMGWICYDDNGLLIDYDIDFGKLKDRMDASGKEGVYTKSWFVVPKGTKVRWLASDPDEEYRAFLKGPRAEFCGYTTDLSKIKWDNATVYHGRESHPIADSPDCKVCVDARIEFEEAKKNGTLDKLW